MTPERYSQVKSLFQLVLDQPPAQRPAFLERACGADRELYNRVVELLKSDSTSEKFLDSPAVTPLSKLLADVAAEPEPLPGHIGPYAVQKLIGSGGMGAVYLAHRADRSYNKQVAIKVIHKGLESDRILQRFRRERQIIASLDHPNIARLLDGGATEDGRPYIVMEYVEGMPITHYCDLRRLSTEARLRIFLQVCDAIQYAHQNLIIHRDIKPGNILVRPDNTVKLLDFGIAKLLTAENSMTPTEKTATSMRLMTPQYASPEQIRGETVTTASDVYLLGIVLYELLTGHRPYEVNDNAAMEAMRAFAQGEPQRPSEAIFRTSERPAPNGGFPLTTNALTISAVRETNAAILLKKLQGGLDAILLRALRRNPADRYQSVAQFAQDLRNHLAELPVSAVPDTPAYRLRLFLRRNLGPSLAASAAIVMLILVTVFALWQASSARAERLRAETRFSELRKISHTLLFEVQESLEPLPGTAPARRLLVEKALEYLSSLSKEAGADAELEREIAAGYLRLGHLQGNPNHQNLGDTAGAMANYAKAISMMEDLHKRNPNDQQTAGELASAKEALADMQTLNRDFAAAIAPLRAAVQLRESSKSPPESMAASYQQLALALASAGDKPQAMDLSQKAQALAPGFTGPDAQRQRAKVQSRMAAVFRETGETEKSVAAFRTALDLYQQLAAADPLSARAKRDLAGAIENLAGVSAPPDAVALFERSLQIRRNLALAHPNNIEFRRDLAYALWAQGSEDEALESFRQISLFDPSNFIVRRDLARAWERRGLSQRKAGQFPAAAASFRNFLQSARDWVQQNPANPYANQLMAAAHIRLAQVLPQAADQDGARDNARTAVRILDNLLEKDPANSLFRRSRAAAQWALGRSLLEIAATSPEQDLWQQSQTELQKAQKYYQELAAQNQLVGEDRAAPQAVAADLDRCRQRLSPLPAGAA